MSERLFLLANPVAGGGRGRRVAERVRAELARLGRAFDESVTHEPGEAGAIAARLSSRDYSRLLLVGGDGTIADVLPGLIQRDDAPLLAVIPGGTGNDAAKTMGVFGANAVQATATALDGAIRTLDIGLLDGRPFLNGFGAGLDGTVAARALHIPFRFGMLTYLLALATELPAWRPLPYEIDADGERHSGEATLVAIAHGKVCGGGFRLTPRADPTDGKLDLCIVDRCSRAEIVFRLKSAISGRHVDDPNVVYRQVKAVDLRFRRPAVGHVDGNLVPPRDRFRVETLPAGIRVVGAK